MGVTRIPSCYSVYCLFSDPNTPQDVRVIADTYRRTEDKTFLAEAAIFPDVI